MTKTSRLIFAVTLAYLAATTAQACSCVEYLVAPADALKKSALVFSGEVASITTVILPIVVYTKNEDGSFTPAQLMRRRGVVTFNVLRQWKGEPTKNYAVLAAAPPEKPLPSGMIEVDCDVHFEIGKKYLVFTTDGYTEANVCAPTGLLDNESGTMLQLDRIVTAQKRPK